MYVTYGGICSICGEQGEFVSRRVVREGMFPDQITQLQRKRYSCDHCSAGPMCWNCFQQHRTGCVGFGMF
jgi:hypothetical protein